MTAYHSPNESAYCPTRTEATVDIKGNGDDNNLLRPKENTRTVNGKPNWQERGSTTQGEQIHDNGGSHQGSAFNHQLSIAIMHINSVAFDRERSQTMLLFFDM